MIRIAYLGDLIFGDQPVKFGYGSYHSNRNYDFFGNVSSVLKSFDYTIANFEAVIKEDVKDKNISNWSMVTTRDVVRKIKNSGINGVSIANNHTMDYGIEWFNYTVAQLEKEGIQVFGKKEELCKVIEVKGLKVGVVCFSDLKVKISDVGYCSFPDNTDFLAIKDELKEADLRVAYCHWGSEFIIKPTKEQVSRLELICNYNFDCIIGHHAHVIQDCCLFKKTPVFFSIGNFVSDYWQDRARRTMILIHEIEQRTSSFKYIDCYIDNLGRPKLRSKRKDVLFKEFDNIIVTNKEINNERWRLRKEYLVEILFNFYKIRGKSFLIKWMVSRLIYILGNFNKEKKDPNIIYEKY